MKFKKDKPLFIVKSLLLEKRKIILHRYPDPLCVPNPYSKKKKKLTTKKYIAIKKYGVVLATKELIFLNTK